MKTAKKQEQAGISRQSGLDSEVLKIIGKPHLASSQIAEVIAGIAKKPVSEFDIDKAYEYIFGRRPQGPELSYNDLLRIGSLIRKRKKFSRPELYLAVNRYHRRLFGADEFSNAVQMDLFSQTG